MKIIFYRIFISIFFLFLCIVNVHSQVKKPKITVIPSDALLQKMGYLDTEGDTGEMEFTKHYKKAFLDTDLNGVIAKFNELMTTRGMDVMSMQAMLNTGKPKSVDIQVLIEYSLNKVGPQKKLTFSMTAIDNYSQKQIAGATGESSPSISASLFALLQEAVIDKMDPFLDQLRTHFNNIQSKGAETQLTINTNKDISDIKVDGIELEDFVQKWLEANCVNGSFSIDSDDGNELEVSQSMMPLLDGKGRGNDARKFYKSLAKALEQKGFNVKLLRPAGLGLGAAIINLN